MRRALIALSAALWAFPALAQDLAPEAARPAARPEAASRAAPELPAPPAAQWSERADGIPLWREMAERPHDLAACLRDLHALGVSFTRAPTRQDARDPDCGIAFPVQVEEIRPELAITGGATLRCDTARQLALWLRDWAEPAALRAGFILNSLAPGSTYDCRARRGDGSGKLSEHSLGNALDIMGFEVMRADQPEAAPLPIMPRNGTGDLDEAFQATLRGAACLYFTTVLGPGSDGAHEDHLHLDLRARNAGWRICQ